MSIHDDSTQRLRLAAPDADAATARMPGPLDLTDSDSDSDYGTGTGTGTGTGADAGTGWPDPPTDADADVAAAVDVTEQAPAERTEVLFLDEIFETSASDSAAPAAPATPAAAEAPTWTAMPVVPVRSEPVHAYDSPPATADPAASGRSETAQRLRADAQAAWAGTLRRTSTWLSAGDNAVILLTSLVAILLIAVVATLA